MPWFRCAFGNVSISLVKANALFLALKLFGQLRNSEGNAHVNENWMGPLPGKVIYPEMFRKTNLAGSSCCSLLMLNEMQ